ncbi:MAG: DUF2341 domain-containing protein [Candidatus Eisenbacteria bacterium]|nr:DUF2341 domain-containing protein [Candidatus Eisenbacteria bacterium]
MRGRVRIAAYGAAALLLATILFVIEPVQAQWLPGGWDYRRGITITDSDTVLTDYQVKVVLTCAQDSIFALAKENGEDVRFTDADGLTLLNHWIEIWDKPEEYAVIWVKVQSIPVEGITIYLYFGNPEADSASNGNATFEFFEDFEAWGSAFPRVWLEKQPLPTGIADAGAAVCDNKLYLFGGYRASTSDWLKETYEYDPFADTWSRKADMPTARWGPTAVEFNGLIHVFAGYAGRGSRAHEVYDSSTDTWATWSSVPSGLADQGLMGVRYGDKIHLFYKANHYEYDPGTDIYTRKADIPTWRTWGACAAVDDKIYVIGGYSYGPGPTGAINVNEAYDPLTDTWATKEPLPVSKYGVVRENPVIGGKIYVVPGLDGGFHLDNYAYDPATDSWEQKSPAIHPRDGVAGGVINNKLYSAGGRDVVWYPKGICYNEEYDPLADTSTVIPPTGWTVSSSANARPDPPARYEGSYGLLLYNNGQGVQYAEHCLNLPTLALDLYWKLTNTNSPPPQQPQASISLTDSTSEGSLHFYRDYWGVPKFKWYRNTFTLLEAGAYNFWFPITIFWNGPNSKVTINGTKHSVQAASVSPDRIRLAITPGEVTDEYFDLFRVRKCRAQEPTVQVYVDGGGLMAVDTAPLALYGAVCALEQNVPNPFNPETAIRFALKTNGNVNLRIYNLQGRLVRILVNTEKEAGNYSVLWNGTDDDGVGVASGVYVCTLRVNGFETNKKLTFLK